MNIPLATATLFSVLFAPAPAQSQQEGAAESLFRQAREEMKRGEPAAACPKFAESYRLDPSIGTLLNLALCEEALGHTATAWSKLRQFLDVAPAEDGRIRLAREKLEKLEAQLPWLSLAVAPDSDLLLVQLDDVELRTASLSQAIPVDPGEHLVRISRPTGEFSETPFRIQPAEKLALRVSAPPRQAPVVPPVAPRSDAARSAPSAAVTAIPQAASNSRSTERAIAYGLGAVGVAGLVTSGVFGLMALHDRNVVHEECPNHECESQAGLDAVDAGARNAQIANVALVAGALGLVTGGVLFWHSGRATAAVSVGPSSACLSLTGVIQ